MILDVMRKLKRRAHKSVRKGSIKIHPLLREHFNAGWYLASNPDLSDIKDLLEHYVSLGWREGRDPAENFSIGDYLESYPDVRKAGIDPYLHYLAHGRNEARKVLASRKSPSRHRHDFFLETGIYFANYPDDQFRSDAYAHAAGIPSVTRWQALSHFINHGILEARLIAAAKPSGGLLRIIGERIASHSPDKALRCYQLALQMGECDNLLLHELGDIYMHRGLSWNACESYQTALNQGSKYFWTHFNLAHCLQSLGDYAGAIEFYDRAWRLRPQRLSVRYARDSAANERFWVRLAVANSLATEGRDDAACKEIEKAVAEYRDLVIGDDEIIPNPSPREDRELRLAIFGLESIPQCRLYRVQQKIDQLRHVGLNPDLFSQTQAQMLRNKVGLYDAVIVYRLPAFPEVIDVLVTARRFGVTTFFDIDDLVFDADLYPPSRKSLADVVSPVEYAGLVTGRSLHHEAMALCDYGIASTPPLQAAMAKIVRQKKCFLSRNALGHAHIDAMAEVAVLERVPKAFVIFYGSGTNTHNADFALVAAAVAAILRQHPEARFHVAGPVDIGKWFAGLGSQVVKLGFTSNLEAYWSEVARADINLAPLTTSGFNDAKSEIKWMEAAMLGVPSIVSSSATFDAVIRSGEDGFIARSPQDWKKFLERLITDRELGRRVGAAARARVFEEYGLEACGRSLAKDITSVLPAPAVRSKPLILVVNVFYPPEYIGGATRVAEQCAADILSRYGDEFEIEVFCGRDADGRPGSLDRYRWNGITVTSLSPFGDVDAIERSVETFSCFDMYLDQIKPDLVHFHCIQLLSASLIDAVRDKAIPYVVTAHDGWWISDKQFLIDEAGVPVSQSGAWGDPRRLKRLRDCLLGARVTIAVSRSHGQLYRSRGIDNTVVISNGSETLADVPSPPSRGPVWLGLLGGFGGAKGTELLREALHCRHFENLRFLLVDHRMLEGTERSELWGTNEVRIIGKTSFENVGRVYGFIHGLLAISICVESFGLVAREAQRLGRWVIASNRGGMADDLTPGVDGFVIDPSNAKDLLSVLDQINANPSRFRRPPPKPTLPLRERSDVVDDLVRLYRSILSGETVAQREAAE